MATKDWSDLPICILGLIIGRLRPVPDYLRCQAVCRTWRMAVTEIPPNSLIRKPQPPWLMIIPRQLPGGALELGRYCLCSLSDHQERSLYHLNTNPSFGLRCVGSSHGWLVMTDSLYNLHLLNPITGAAHRRLPSVAAFQGLTYQHGPDGQITNYRRHTRATYGHFSSAEDMSRYYYKVIVFSMAVFVIHSSAYCLSYARPADESWTVITTEKEKGRPTYHVLDVAKYKGKFYGITRFGDVVAFDIASPPPPTHHEYFRSARLLPPVWKSRIPWPDNVGRISRYYLVASVDGKDLLLVCRFCSDAAASVFVVVRLLLDSDKWVRVENLEGCAIFLGENTATIAISTEEVPELRGNCIYFTQVKEYQPHEPVPRDAGIFHLGDGTITPWPCYHHPQFIFDFDSDCSPPHHWLTPTI